MRDVINHFVFGWYPYLALIVFLLGSLIRFDREQYTWRSQSSQFLRRRQLAWGSNLFHIGILFLFFGHLVGLLTPSWIYSNFISIADKQTVAVVAGGIAGLICFAGLSMLLHRRLFDVRIRVTSSSMDIAVLVILWVQLVLGLMTLPLSLLYHSDGHTMVKLAHWAQGLVTLEPNIERYLEGVHWPYKAHIFLGMTIFLVFPFTRLVHVWSAPIWYLGRRGYQIVRSRDHRAVSASARGAGR